MKVIVRDAEILKNIELEQLRDYLQSHAWRRSLCRRSLVELAIREKLEQDGDI